MSQAAVLQSQYRYNQTQILFLTQISEQEYHSFLIDTAKAWAARYWQHTVGTDTLLKTVQFWRWWTGCWNDIDDRFILQSLYAVPPATRYAAYREMHQYVFDNDNQYQQLMLKDFRNLEAHFERAINKISKV